MLKLTITTGDRDYEKPLEALSKAVARVTERGVESGLVRVYAYPSPDSLAASGIAVFYLYTRGVGAAVRVTARPPSATRAPSILLGFSQISIKGGNAEELVAIASGSLSGQPPPGATYAEVEGSVASALALALLKAGFKPSPDLASLIIASLYGGRYVSPHGRFTGLDRVLLDKIEGDTVELDYVTTIKVYKPDVGDLCEALGRTVNPYYPGLTGEVESCKSTIRQSLGDVAAKPPASLDKDEIMRVIDVLVDYMESIVGSVEPRNYVAGLVVAPRSTPRDPREAMDAMIAAAEGLDSPLPFILPYTDPTVDYPVMEVFLESLGERLSKLYELRPRRLKGPGWLRVYIVDFEDVVSPTLAWRALNTIGYMERESLLAVRRGEEILVSPIQAEEALGPGGAKRLVDTHAASERPGRLYLKLEVSTS